MDEALTIMIRTPQSPGMISTSLATEPQLRTLRSWENHGPANQVHLGTSPGKVPDTVN